MGPQCSFFTGWKVFCFWQLRQDCKSVGCCFKAVYTYLQGA
nr:unnamed protein product [Callosobruchus chinensis]